MERIIGKLVRDNIPEIIRQKGQTPHVRILDNAEYLACLHRKLQEEVSEYLEENCLAELCDILEVVDALIAASGYTPEEAAAFQAEKARTNGKFEKKLFLEKVSE